MNKRDKTVTTLVLTALLTTLTLLCTMLLKIPVGPDCYIHLGDAVIFLAVIILPRKHAAFVGGVGAALADLLGGFAFWAPATFVIKILVVIIFGFCIDRVKENSKKILGLPSAEFFGYIIASIVGVLGYFIAEYILFGNWVAAATCIPLNCLQMGVGAVICVLISNSLSKSGFAASIRYKRPL